MPFICVVHSGPFCAPSGGTIVSDDTKSLGLQLLHVQCLKNRSSTANTQGPALRSFVVFMLVPAAITESMQ